MAHLAPGGRLAGVFAPLGTAFGDRVQFARDGSCAWWSYENHHAIVEMSADGSIEARFVAPPRTSAVRAYALTQAGCERMVDDMLAFFSGAREPRFTFVDAR